MQVRLPGSVTEYDGYPLVWRSDILTQILHWNVPLELVINNPELSQPMYGAFRVYIEQLTSTASDMDAGARCVCGHTPIPDGLYVRMLHIHYSVSV